MPQTLIFRASSGGVLQVHHASGWTNVCTESCTTLAVAGDEYRVAGDGIVTSRTFVFQPSPYPMLLNADAGSTSARTVGIVFTTLGAIGLLAGSVLLIDRNGSHGSRSDSTDTAIIIAVPSGAGLLAAGIIMIAANNTRLEFLPAPAPAASESPRLRLAKGLELTAEGIRF